jgi:hypothetical protein
MPFNLGQSQTANGNTMIDGPTNITNLDETEANKALASIYN